MKHWLIALALVACGKDSAQKQAEKEGEKMAMDYVVGRVKDELPKLEAALASAKPSDGTFKCAHMANIDVVKQSDPALAAKFEKICTHDLQLAIMKVAVEQAEAARKAKPDEKVLSECFNAEYEVAHEDLQKAGKLDGTAKALETRLATVCPKS